MQSSLESIGLGGWWAWALALALAVVAFWVGRAGVGVPGPGAARPGHRALSLGLWALTPLALAGLLWSSPEARWAYPFVTLSVLFASVVLSRTGTAGLLLWQGCLVVGGVVPPLKQAPPETGLAVLGALGLTMAVALIGWAVVRAMQAGGGRGGPPGGRRDDDLTLLEGARMPDSHR